VCVPAIDSCTTQNYSILKRALSSGDNALGGSAEDRSLDPMKSSFLQFQRMQLKVPLYSFARFCCEFISCFALHAVLVSLSLSRSLCVCVCFYLSLTVLLLYCREQSQIVTISAEAVLAGLETELQRLAEDKRAMLKQLEDQRQVSAAAAAAQCVRVCV
jgi:hypothetical protein